MSRPWHAFSHGMNAICAAVILLGSREFIFLTMLPLSHTSPHLYTSFALPLIYPHHSAFISRSLTWCSPYRLLAWLALLLHAYIADLAPNGSIWKILFSNARGRACLSTNALRVQVGLLYSAPVARRLGRAALKRPLLWLFPFVPPRRSESSHFSKSAASVVQLPLCRSPIWLSLYSILFQLTGLPLNAHIPIQLLHLFY